MDHRHDRFSGTPPDNIRRAQMRATQIRYLGVRISILEGIRLFLMYKIAVGEKWPKNPSFRKQSSFLGPSLRSGRCLQREAGGCGLG